MDVMQRLLDLLVEKHLNTPPVPDSPQGFQGIPLETDPGRLNVLFPKSTRSQNTSGYWDLGLQGAVRGAGIKFPNRGAHDINLPGDINLPSQGPIDPRLKRRR